MLDSMRCLTREELKNFLLGKLPEDFSSQISQHLDECNTCEDTVVGLEQTSDSLLASLHQSNSRSDEPRPCYEQNPDFELAMAGSHQALNARETSTEPSSEIQRIGDYEILKTVGRGGMGSVFEGRHRRLDKRVAIKILPNRKMRSPDAVARFNREMKIVGQMSHPAVVSAFDAGEEDGTHYLVMELVDGVDLGQIVRLCGPISISNACALVSLAATGVQYAHEQGIIHRDIKPSNLMLNRAGDVKVLDLGLATLSDLNGSVDELTTVGQLMGTLDYMAPEQCGSEEPVTSQSDVYGLAATLYKLLTGTSPYSTGENDTPLKKLRSMACSEPVPIRNRRASIPASLANIMDQGLMTDPSRRLASAAEFADQLAPFTEDQDLNSLLDRAIELRSNKPGSQSNGLLVVEKQQQSRKASKSGNSSASSMPTRSWIGNLTRLLAMAALIGGFIWGGIVIYLCTNTGQLIIESEVDDVKVSVLKNDQPTKELIVEHDSSVTRLFAGQYKVKIKGDSDALVVENGEFQIMRGKVAIVRIREKEDAIAVTDGNLLQDAASQERLTESLPTYEGGDIYRWTERIDQKNGGTYAKNYLEQLGPLTPITDQKKAVERAFKQFENELSTRSQSKLIYGLSPLAESDEIANMLLDYCVDKIGSTYEYTTAQGQYFGFEKFALEPTMLFVGAYNQNALEDKINQIVFSGNPKLRRLAVFCASHILEKNDKPWSDPDFKLDEAWIPALLESCTDQESKISHKAQSLLIERFPNNPRVVEYVHSSNDRSLLKFILEEGCKDRKLIDKLLHEDLENKDAIDGLWDTALAMKFANQDSTMIDAILDCLADERWGNEIYADVSKEKRDRMNELKNVGYFRARLGFSITPRISLIKSLNVPLYQSGNPRITGMMGSISGGGGSGAMLGGMMSSAGGTKRQTYGLKEEDFNKIAEEIRPRVDAALLKQGQFEFANIERPLREQIYLVADTTLSKPDESFRSVNNINFVTTLRYRGLSLNEWLGKIDEASPAEFTRAIAFLWHQAADKSQLLLKVIPEFSNLDLSGLHTDSLDETSRLALSIFSRQGVSVRIRGKGNYNSNSRVFQTLLIKHINDFPLDCANFLLACLATNRRLVDQDENDRVQRFFSTTASLEDDDVVRRTIFVSLGLKNSRLLPSDLSDTARNRMGQVYASNASAHAAALRNRFVFSGDIVVVRKIGQAKTNYGGLEIDDAGRVATVLSLANDLERSPLTFNSSAGDRKRVSFLDRFAMQLLSVAPEFLDKPLNPESYDYWDDRVFKQNEDSDRSPSMIAYLVDQLDEGKIRIPWPVDWDDSGNTPKAIEYLEKRLKDARGPIKLKLDRVLNLYKQKSPNYPKR